MTQEKEVGEGELDWAGRMGDYWLANLLRFEEANAEIGRALLAHAALAPGERIVEIGSGGGRTTAEIARATGPEGLVVGVDISPALVAEARRWAREQGLTNVRIVEGDAAEVRLAEAPFDRLLSRFGIMFFRDPQAGFSNLHRLLRPGGRLDAAVWASLAENPWRREVVAAVRRHVSLPQPPARAPGPFALGERAYFRALLEEAGFRDVVFTAWEGVHRIGTPGTTPAEAADFIFGAMNLAEVTKGSSPAVVAALKASLADLFAHNCDAGGVRLPAKAWIVTALSV